ncbi:MAG: hypothetical protein PHU36_10285, partial [Syntrophomonadaceae bacterium]|nr:hypothetical protein [Syntrophomonadaceae bacterium]
NKYDTNLGNTRKIESFCQVMQLPLTGMIPYDPEAVKAVNEGRSIVDAACPSGQAVRNVFNETLRILNETNQAKERVIYY